MQLLINNWKRVDLYNIWEWPIESYPIVNTFIFILHLVSWCMIYGGSLLMDTPEIFGIKQVSYFYYIPISHFYVNEYSI